MQGVPVAPRKDALERTEPGQTAADPAALRTALADSTVRPHDLAANLGVPEGALVAARTGHGTARIDPAPNRLISLVGPLGEVMALTATARA